MSISKKSSIKTTSNNSFVPRPATLNFTYETNIYIVIISYIIGLIINIFILNWLIKINKCKCANIPEKNLLLEWFIFRIIWINIIFILHIYNVIYVKNNILIFFGVIIMIIDIVMIIRLFLYIRKLKQNNCDCGLSTQENIIYNYLIFVFGFIGALLLILISTLIFMASR
jgi:hypothetical protein